MRTKTPEQIATQRHRILKNVSFSHWNGREYINIDRMIYIFDLVERISERYIDSIYRANGVTELESESNSILSNEIWRNAATERIVYAGY